MGDFLGADALLVMRTPMGGRYPVSCWQWPTPTARATSVAWRAARIFWEFPEISLSGRIASTMGALMGVVVEGETIKLSLHPSLVGGVSASGRWGTMRSR
jgi:hypothetical protein